MARVYQITTGKTNITWEEALQLFLYWKQAQGLSTQTLEDYRMHVMRLYQRFPDYWQKAEMRKCVMEYMGEKIMPATYNLRLNYLGAFFRWCAGEGYLTDNPISGFKRRKASARVVVLPEIILSSLLSLPDQSSFSGIRDYALLLLTLDTGLRPKEAFSLLCEHIDLKHHTISIPPEADKTRRGRILPISAITAEAISKVIKARHPQWETNTPVFCTFEGNRFNRNSWNDRMEMYSKKLNHKIRPYDLRHSFAVMYLRGGGHAFGLQQMLGHSDLQMTKVYVNLVDADLRNIHEKASPLNALLPRQGGPRVRRIP